MLSRSRSKISPQSFLDILLNSKIMQLLCAFEFAYNFFFNIWKKLNKRWT